MTDKQPESRRTKVFWLGVSVLFALSFVSAVTRSLAGTQWAAPVLAQVSLARVYLSEEAVERRRQLVQENGGDVDARVVVVYARKVCTARLDNNGIIDYATLTCNPSGTTAFNVSQEFDTPSCSPKLALGFPGFSLYTVIYSLGLFLVCTFYHHDGFKLALAFASCFIFGLLSEGKIRLTRWPSNRCTHAWCQRMWIGWRGPQGRFWGCRGLGWRGMSCRYFTVWRYTWCLSFGLD